MTSDLPLTLLQMQETLERIFRRTSGIALGVGGYVADVEIAAARASAEIAGVLVGIRQTSIMTGMMGGEEDYYDHSSDPEEELDPFDDSWPSEPE